MRNSENTTGKGARKGLLRNEKGATSIEYALIVSLIFLAIVTAMSSVAEKTNLMWNNVSNAVNEH